MPVFSRPGEGDGCFALVAYLPEPLSDFVDKLRRELVPGSECRGHLTLLPPRPLATPPEAVWKQVQESLAAVAPVEVQLLNVEVFLGSGAIYLSIGQGTRELEYAHRALNHGAVHFDEPWPYHPHVTLAQDLEPSQIAGVVNIASKRWREFTGVRSFTLDQLTFVQNMSGNRWLDLALHDLRKLPAPSTL